MENRRDEKLLKEIRERYRYLSDCWREAREQRAIDMRYLLGDPWEERDRKARDDANRPCISHDELTQYVNQAINALRQNKRGIKVGPEGNGADEKTAELHQDLIRTIEYKSQAQAAYLAAFEPMVQGGYGFFRISRRYVSDEGFDQEICIKPLQNSDAVLVDWDAKEPDWSDARDCFVLDPMPREEFEREYPDAEVKSFSVEDSRVAPEWIQEKNVLVAEYWRVERTPEKLYLLPDGQKVTKLPAGVQAVRTRRRERKQVVQYITNGVEILERNPQPGKCLPIIPDIGRQLWVTEGGVTKRKILSLIRLARDPQMSLAFLCSQEAEEAGLSPKVPYVGYKGQFESDAEAWETANKIPHSYLQVDPIVDGAGGQVLPLPRREQFTPNFGPYEIAKDACRRAVQAAMGISPLPTAAQRNNEKSGVALERIQTAQAIGSFHFLDNHERALQYAGRVIEEWIPVTYDTERELALQKEDDSRKMVRLNTAEPYPDPKTNEPLHFPVDQGSHDVTVSAGPSSQLQWEAASEFLDLLVANLGKLPIAPPQQAKLLSLAIRMKRLGPKGDQIADLISPPEGEELPAQAQQIMQQAEQKLQALNAYAQQIEKEREELQRKLDAKVTENEYRLKIEQLKIEGDITKAEITTKAQDLRERMAFVEDMLRQLQVQAHEQGMAAQQQASAEQVAIPAPAVVPEEQVSQ